LNQVVPTSYLDEAERAFHVLVLDAGREVARGTPEQIAAATPGVIRVVPTRPAGEAARRAWRRNAQWRVWDPGGAGQPAGQPPGEPGGEPVPPDLQDAITVAELVREAAISTGAPQ
jgi:ABC-2 type transport system ATP-binding protein